MKNLQNPKSLSAEPTCVSLNNLNFLSTKISDTRSWMVQGVMGYNCQKVEDLKTGSSRKPHFYIIWEQKEQISFP